AADTQRPPPDDRRGAGALSGSCWWLVVSGWFVVRGSWFALVVGDLTRFSVKGLERFDQTVKHSPDAINAGGNLLVIDIVDVREAPRDLDLHVNLALRSQGNIKMIEVSLSAFSPATFTDIGRDR